MIASATYAAQVEEDLAFIERLILGKARKRPSILTESGFITQLLKESRKLVREVKRTIGSKEIRAKLAKSTNIDWTGITDRQREEAIDEVVSLIKGLPSNFAKGVNVVLDDEGAVVFDKTHRALGRQYKSFAITPAFALKNKRAITALRESTSIFFADEYERQGVNFRKRAQKTLADGLDKGFSSREIGAALKTEFAEVSTNPGYWQVVASNHVSRARSFSSLATYAENGITQYQIVAVKDERTTEICIMLDGKIFSVQSGLDNLDRFEDAKDLDEVKRVSPFLTVSKDLTKIRTPSGKVVASRSDPGKSWSSGKSLSATGFNNAGINSPPYHHACRTTIVPVFDLGKLEQKEN